MDNNEFRRRMMAAETVEERKAVLAELPHDDLVGIIIIMSEWGVELCNRVAFLEGALRALGVRDGGPADDPIVTDPMKLN